MAYLNKAMLAEMYVGGMSIPEISKETGVAKSMVRYYVRSMGVKMRTRKEALALIKPKLSKANKGRKHIVTDETREKLSAAQFKRWEGVRKGYGEHNGYIRFTAGEHKGRLQHIVVMEQHIGRELQPQEVVHHINGNRKDNRIENLQLMTREDHSKLHLMLRLNQ